MYRKINILRPMVALCLIVSMAGSACKKDDGHQASADKRCDLGPDPGICNAVIPRYYYDKDEKRCKLFNWGGCAEIQPFATEAECLTCKCRD